MSCSARRSIAAEAFPPQDLDLGLRGRGTVDLVALTNEFIRQTGIQEIDLVDLRRADPVLLALVARDGVPLYEAEPTEFARFASLAVRRSRIPASFGRRNAAR